MVGIPGAHGKVAASDLDRVLAASGRGVVHHVQAASVSISQASEAGTIYRPDEIAAIAEHQHIPEIAATELGSFLLSTQEGRQQIKRMIVDDLVRACESGDESRADRLRTALAHYVAAHPDSL